MPKTSSTDKLAGQASTLASMVDYQESSIVSRTLIDKKEGTVTLFAFDADQALSEHTAPFDALVYVFDGEAEVSVSGKPTKVGAGMVTLLPAGKPHAVKAVSRFKMMLVMVRAESSGESSLKRSKTHQKASEHLHETTPAYTS